MSLTFSQAALVAHPGQQLAMSALLGSTPDGQPEYVVLVGLDRERYTASSTGERGTLEGNGHSATFTAYPGSDSYALGLVFTLTAQGYFNSRFGLLSEMSLTASSDNFRSEYLALYGFGTAGTSDPALQGRLEAEVGGQFFDGGAFMSAHDYPDAVHLGTLDVVTRSNYTDLTPGAATPGEIVAVAASYVGQVWDDNGCWILASNIAASAGASLPLTSDESHPGLTPPVANGQWMVAYNSAAATEAQQATWQALLRPGDVVVSNNSCGGHIATVVGGSGYSSLFLDNSGAAAGDGDAHDIVVEGAHSMVPWAIGPDPANVVIYRLGTPVVTVLAPLCLAANGSAPVAPLFSTLDPAGRAITGYQFYDTGGATFTVDGTPRSGASAAAAISVSAASLASVSFKAGAANGSDSIMVRAYNGSYWGDWQGIDVAIGSAIQPAQVHAVSDTLFVHGGNSVALASLFSAGAPASPVMSYTITQSAFGGAIDLNGAIDLLNGPHDWTAPRSYEVSAADFAKVNFVASRYAGAETLTVVAHNGAALASLPAVVSVATLTPTVHTVSHWVGLGELVPLSSLFSVTLPDAVAVTSYSVSTQVSVVDWGDMTPSQGGTIVLNGAVNLLASSGAPAGNYEIAAADLDKVSFLSAPNAGAQFITISANDGGGGANGTLVLTTVAGPALLTPIAHSVGAGESISMASLFSLASGAAAPLYYRFTDPEGGGAIRLDHEATNLQSKDDLTPGLTIIAANDLARMRYVGGSTGGAELLTVSASSDMQHWSAEARLAVTTLAAPVHAVTGGSAGDVLRGSAGNDAFDGGAGLDTVVLDGARSHFNVVRTDNGITVTDLTGADGKDSMSGVERIRFADGALAFDTDGSAGQLFRLYQAAFDRQPDLGGMGFWLAQADAGATLSSIAGGFMASEEFGRLYGAGVSDAQFVGRLYHNVLHRAPDGAGFDFWMKALADGYTRTDLLLGFADSGENHAQLVGAMQNGIAYIYGG